MFMGIWPFVADHVEGHLPSYSSLVSDQHSDWVRPSDPEDKRRLNTGKASEAELRVGVWGAWSLSPVPPLGLCLLGVLGKDWPVCSFVCLDGSKRNRVGIVLVFSSSSGQRALG